MRDSFCHFSRRLGNEFQVIAIWLIPLLILTSCKLELDTKISLVDTHNPPSFKLSGTGSGPIFLMGGPYSRVDGVGPGTRLWELTATPEIAGQPVWRLPEITYGKVPSGFVQRFPEGQAASLEEGKYYCIFVHVHGARAGRLCFTIREGKALKVARK